MKQINRTINDSDSRAPAIGFGMLLPEFAQPAFFGWKIRTASGKLCRDPGDRKLDRWHRLWNLCGWSELWPVPGHSSVNPTEIECVEQTFCGNNGIDIAQTLVIERNCCTELL